jgi:UDP-N-acetyl-2-amino-2-deoxyglucuronate dehydrogenase
MNKVNIGILGLGRVAEHHKLYLKKNKRINVSACCDLDSNKIEKFSKYYNSKNNFTSIKKFAASNSFELAIISTPSGFHYAHSKILLENKKHVLVEKPASLKINQHLNLFKLSKKKKLFYDVILQNRLNKAILFLKNALVKKKLGKILKVNVRVNWCRYQEYYNDIWHGKWKMDGGVICQQAYHHIDILSHLFPDISTIYAEKYNLSNKLEAEDTFSALGTFSDGSTFNFEATTAIRPNDHEASIIVYGDKGYIEIGGIAINEIKTFKLKKVIINNFDNYNQKFKTGYGTSHKIVFDEIAKKIQNKDYDSLNNPQEVEKTLCYIHNFYKSSKIQKKINFSKNNKFSKLG